MNHEIIILDQKTLDQDKWNKLVDNTEAGVPFVYYNFLISHNDINVFFFIVLDTNTNNYIGGISCRIRGSKRQLLKQYQIGWMDSSVLIDNEFNYYELFLKNLILETLIFFAKKNKLIALQFSHWAREITETTLLKYEFKIEENWTFEIDLSKTEDEIFHKLNSTCRKKVSRAKKNEIIVKHFTNEDCKLLINDVIKLHTSTYNRAARIKRSSMQFRSYDFIEDLFEKLSDKVIVSCAYYLNKMVSINVSFYKNKTVFPYLAGNELIDSNIGISNFLFFDLFLFLKRKGFLIYDMGGVPYKPTEKHPAYGVYKFKESFGGEFKVFYSGYYSINRFKYFLFNLILSSSVFKKIMHKIINN